jgi:amino acid adenylation domain-containing protein
MLRSDQPAERAFGTSDRVPVKLPTDVLRTALTPYEAALVRSEASVLAGLGDEAGRARIAAALGAVLSRYTEQELIALDLCVDAGAGEGRAWVSLDCAVPAEGRLSQLVDQALAALASLPEPESRASEVHSATNVAVTFSSLEGDVVAREDESRRDLHFIVQAGKPELVTLYNASLFKPSTVQRIAGSLLAALDALARGAEQSVHELPLVSEAERRRVQVDWDSGSLNAIERPVHQLFEDVARERPDALALRFGADELRYGELERRANRLAQHLLASGVTPGSRVAVCVLPSFDIIVGMLAIFKVGAVYVPLDPTHPEVLIANILEEASPKLVLTQSKIAGLTQPELYRQFCFDTEWAGLAALPESVPGVSVAIGDPVYILYTSGTTGKPKGVVATHENLAHYLHVARDKYGFTASDRFCSLARYTFSISMWELLSPLTIGASLRLLIRDDVLAPERFAQTLEEVTVVHAGPSLLGNLFRHLRAGVAPRLFPNLRHASSGGDIVPPSVIEEMKVVFPNAELFVIYGCTEISCMGCTYPIDRAHKVTHSFVGKAFPDVTVRVTDPFGNLVPVGVIGEICFAGKGVVQGYLDRPALTAEKFVAREGKRFYRTGDMGRLHDDGNVEILGRRDYQVQLRGIRVELPGIENVVRETGLAATCAVAMKKLDDHDVRLVAFVVAPREASIGPFRKALAQHLPDYMLPQGLVVLDALPLTRNGKLDRAALDALPWQPEAAPSGGAAPTSLVEQQIARAFAEALGRSEVGIDDDFFDLGGHSLLAVTVTEKLENVLGLSLPPGLLFEYPTVRGLAAQTRNTESLGPKPIPLGRTRDKPPLFMLLGVHLYRELARLLEEHYSSFGIYAESELLMLEDGNDTVSVEQLAREYVNIIRRAEPHGPYRIAGMSFGGIVAYEVAQQLRDAGEEVTFLGLIDAILPERSLGSRIDKLKRLAKLPARDQLRMLTVKLDSVIKDVFGRRNTPAEFTRHTGIPELARREQLREAAYFRATTGYVKQMRPFQGPAVLITSGKRLERNPLESESCGFAPYVKDLEVHVFDAEHLALVEPPTVERLAHVFRASLTRAPDVGRSSGRTQSQDKKTAPEMGTSAV